MLDEQKYDVFISYSKRDYVIADKIVRALNAGGFTYFRDQQGFEPGSDYLKSIINAIDNCRLFVCVLSENAYSSGGVLKELEYALERESNVVLPVIVDNSHLPDRLEFSLSSLNIAYWQFNRSINVEDIIIRDVGHALGLFEEQKESKEIECQKKYDVFISSRSADYHLAEEVYDFLMANGLSVFIASEELKKIGEAKYADAIDEVLDNSLHMIVVASSLNNIKSKWVKYEWSTFSNDLKSGYRDGNLLTILNGDVELKTLPASLRHQQSFRLESYKKEILDYLQIRQKDDGGKRQDDKPQRMSTPIAVFKFYSNENCQILLEGTPIAVISGMSEEPYRFPVSRRGDYRFKYINSITAEVIIRKEYIDADEEKDIDILWTGRRPFNPDYAWLDKTIVSGEKYIVDLGALKFNMIRVEGGEMMIGATDEQTEDAESNEHPAHLVTLSTFYIGQFPVTQNIWELVMGYNKSKKQEERQAINSSSIPKMSSAGIGAGIGALLGPVGAIVGGTLGWLAGDKGNKLMNNDDAAGHYPAENLSHDEAIEFVRRLSEMINVQFDLPTEEEWEYAARGGQKSEHYRYAGSDNIDDVAWYRNNSEGSTHPVGEKQPNELGLYDMCGNVWEWTKTPAHSYATNIEPDGDIFIRRGGSWWHEDKNCRVSRRYASDHTKKTSGLGLRVVIRKNVE